VSTFAVCIKGPSSYYTLYKRQLSKYFVGETLMKYCRWPLNGGIVNIYCTEGVNGLI